MATSLTLGPASLITDDQNRLYHIEAGNGDLAHAMILVGDPHRAEWFAQTFFRPGFRQWEHRGHVFATGHTKNGYRMSVLTTAMGIGSTNIVVTEAIAAHVLDLPKRKPRKNPPTTALFRVGTCGALQEDLELGVPIVSTGAIGLDADGLYNYRKPNKLDRLAEELSLALIGAHNLRRKRGEPRISFPTYATPASPKLLKAVASSAKKLGIRYNSGITITAPGFYHSQGRSILPGVAPAISNLDRVIADVDPDILNYEMEAAVIFNAARNCRPPQHAGCICIPVALRATDRFMENMPAKLPEQMYVAGELSVATLESMHDSGYITPD